MQQKDDKQYVLPTIGTKVSVSQQSAAPSLSVYMTMSGVVSGIVGGIASALAFTVSVLLMGEQPFINVFLSLGIRHWGVWHYCGFVLFSVLAGPFINLRARRGIHRVLASSIAFFIWSICFCIFSRIAIVKMPDATSDLPAYRTLLFCPAIAWAVANLLAYFLIRRVDRTARL